jgi:antirestriction protein
MRNAVYVGTYGRYNSGSIFGKWFDLADYAGADEFFAAVAEYHKDEPDPEFMVQDHEGWPFSESFTVAQFKRFYDLVDELDGPDDLELFQIFAQSYNPARWEPVEVDTFRDAYVGTYASEKEYGEETADEMMSSLTALGNIPQELVNYFDYDAWTRDLFMGDVYSLETSDGRKAIFRNV